MDISSITNLWPWYVRGLGLYFRMMIVRINKKDCFELCIDSMNNLQDESTGCLIMSETGKKCLFNLQCNIFLMNTISINKKSNVRQSDSELYIL